MIGTVGGAVLAALCFLFAAVLGIGAGGIASLGFRQSWGLKVALQDGLLAALVAIAAAYVIALVEASRGVWESRVSWVLFIALCSVILKHLIRFTRNSIH
jgi:hypothetical protein